MKKVNVLNWIFGYSKKQLVLVMVGAILNMLIAFAFILLALLSKQVIDITLGSHKGSLLQYCFYFLCIIVLQAGLNILSSNLLVRARGKTEICMKQGVFRSLLTKQMPEIDQLHSGEYINRLTSDIDIVVSGFTSLLPQTLSMAVKLFVGLAVLFYYDARFTAVLTVLGVAAFLTSFLLRSKFKGYHKEVQERDGRTRSFMQECIENLIVIKTFIAHNTIVSRLFQLQRDTYESKLKRNAANNLANTGVYVMFSGGYYLTLVWGALQLASGRLTYGTLMAFLQIFGQVIEPLKNISGMLAQYFSMTASAERLIEIERLPEESAEVSFADISTIYQSMECIRFADISFHYNSSPVFQNASGVINKGGVTAVIGGSGVGKSTLIRLLLGVICAHEGDILLETDQKTWQLNGKLRRLFSYVPQGNMLLSGTIKDNITFFQEDVDEQRIMKASSIACVADFADTMPEGLNTVIGEHGIGLSEGQNQRIAIARALVFEAPVILLDEATSALDNDTEKKLLHNLRLLKDRTCIFISHRGNVVSDCDNIIKIENQKIIQIL